MDWQELVFPLVLLPAVLLAFGGYPIAGVSILLVYSIGALVVESSERARARRLTWDGRPEEAANPFNIDPSASPAEAFLLRRRDAVDIDEGGRGFLSGPRSPLSWVDEHMPSDVMRAALLCAERRIAELRRACEGLPEAIERRAEIERKAKADADTKEQL